MVWWMLLARLCTVLLGHGGFGSLRRRFFDLRQMRFLACNARPYLGKSALFRPTLARSMSLCKAPYVACRHGKMAMKRARAG